MKVYTHSYSSLTNKFFVSQFAHLYTCKLIFQVLTVSYEGIIVALFCHLSNRIAIPSMFGNKGLMVFHQFCAFGLLDLNSMT